MQIKLTTIAIIGVILTILGYAYFNTEALRKGPIIRIDSPAAFSTVEGSVEVKGNIAHVKEATINGRQITFNTRGDFDEFVVLHPPEDTIDIVAKSAYDKWSNKTIQLHVSD